MSDYLNMDEFGKPLFKAIQLSASRRLMLQQIERGKRLTEHAAMRVEITKIDTELAGMWSHLDPQDVRRILQRYHL